jgi:hypothetical protein
MALSPLTRELIPALLKLDTVYRTAYLFECFLAVKARWLHRPMMLPFRSLTVRLVAALEARQITVQAEPGSREKGGGVAAPDWRSDIRPA